MSDFVFHIGTSARMAPHPPSVNYKNPADLEFARSLQTSPNRLFSSTTFSSEALYNQAGIPYKFPQPC